MREVGVLEAKTTFSTLIAEIERTGEPVTVTRHGKPAVRIIPAIPARERMTPEERRAVAEEIIAWRDAQPADESLAATSWDEIKRMIRDENSHD